MQKSVRMDKAPHLPEENQTHHHQKIIAPKSELAIEPNPSCSPHNTFNSILFTHSNNRLQGAAATHEIAASQTDRKTTTTSWVGGFSLLSRNSDLETTTTTTNKMVESSSPSSSSSFSAAAPSSSDTLEIAALKVLYAEDPWTKAEYGDVAARLWLDGSIQFPYLHDSALPPVPRRPARLPTVQLVAPKDMPKLGKGGSLRSRQALLHSLVHTESWAIDLSWDIIARFGKAESMPREFFDDFVKVAQDEGRHFQLLATRLGELGSSYGALPAHDGLWDSAEATAHDLSARLVVEHCVHEARGLDVLPTTISRFRKGGDDLTADLLESVIYPEEITHCAAGVRWFTFLCLQSDPMTCLTTCSRAVNSGLKTSEAGLEDDDISKAMVRIVRLETFESHGNNDGLAIKIDKKGCTLFDDHSNRSHGSVEPVQVILPPVGKEGNAEPEVNDGAGDGDGDGDAIEERYKGIAMSHVSSSSVQQRMDNSSFSALCSQSQGTPRHVIAAFHLLVRKYFRGPLKPPFNRSARAAAGFGPEWYEPLAMEVPVV